MINFLIGMTIAVIIFCLLMVLLSRKGAEEKNISNRMAYFSGWRPAFAIPRKVITSAGIM